MYIHYQVEFLIYPLTGDEKMKPIYNFKIHGPIRNFEMAPQLGCHYLIETSVTAADADGSISTKAIYKKTVP